MKSNSSPVALITGAAQRIGATIAKTLHQQGYNVIIHYRASKDTATKLATQLNAIRGNSAITLQADFNQFSDLSRLIDQSYQQWQRLDALINNASDFFPTPASTATLQEWDLLMNSNLRGPYFLSNYAATYLQQQAGCVVNITDIHGLKPLQNYSIYSIAKAGLITLTKSLAKELAPSIRVNAVAPGPTLWPDKENALSEEDKRHILEKTPLLRQVDPQDIADTVLFFINNSSVTGQQLNVDSGRSLRG